MVEVEEVIGRAAMRRFMELPYFLFRSEPRWAPPLIAAEKGRFDRFRNTRLMDLEHVFLLARHRGQPAGRMAIQVEGDVGVVTAFDVAPAGHVAAELLAAARSWLRGMHIVAIDGPDLLVEGYDVAGVTGRAWHPPLYAESLHTAGFEIADRRRTWRLPATGTPSLTPDPTANVPLDAGRYADRRLLLPGVTAVPDLSEAQGSTRDLVRRAKRRDWSTAVVVEVHGDASVLIPALQAAAAAAGYKEVIAPWSPDADARPETVHARFRASSA